MLNASFSRRTFLQGAAGAAAGISAMDTFSFDAWMKKAQAAPVTRVASLCEVCSAACGMWVHVKNGRVWKVTGQRDHPSSRGRLCARGHAGAAWVYHKDRITHPMKRVGDYDFVPISWEDAYKEISAKLKKVIADHGPGPVFFSQNPRPLGGFYLNRFREAIGSSTTHSHHSICSTARDVANKWTIGNLANADLGATKYIVFLGRNYVEGLSPSSAAQLASAHARGATIVMVDPRQNNSCLFSSQWVPIRPGTDLALLMAISNVLIKEKLYDANFVQEWCVGFDEFEKGMKPYTPEWAASVTDIPAAKIIEIARGLGANKPAACIEQGYKAPNGANYINGTQTFRMMACVNALLGNYNQDGGMKFPVGPRLGSLDSKVYPNPPRPKAARCDGVGIKGEYPMCQTSQGIIHIMPQRAIEGKAKAGFIHRVNPVRNSPDPVFMEEGYKKLDLLVVCDIKWSETAMVAHYVLPECSPQERSDLPAVLASAGRPAVTMRYQAVDIVHPHTKPLDIIITELSAAMGLEKYFNFTREELVAAMLRPLGITDEELRQKGTITFPSTFEKVPKFSTDTKKVELYSKPFAENGYDPVPKWIPPLSKAEPTGDSFVLITGKQGFMSHTTTAGDPYLLEIAKKYGLERVWINADRARRLGIKDGDLVEISSPKASRKLKAKVTERIHPEAAFIPLGYGRYSPWMAVGKDFGVSPNDFAPFRVEEIAGHAVMQDVLLKIRKAGV